MVWHFSKRTVLEKYLGITKYVALTLVTSKRRSWLVLASHLIARCVNCVTKYDRMNKLAVMNKDTVLSNLHGLKGLTF